MASSNTLDTEMLDKATFTVVSTGSGAAKMSNHKYDNLTLQYYVYCSTICK
jgi:hypothetical protein